MEKKTKGAWLLAQSKNLSGYAGAGATRLENVSHSGKIGRLYNLLRRQADDQTTFTISKQTIETTCKLNGIEKSDRIIGLQVLHDAGRIDVAKDGAVAVLGATTQAVLEATAEIFDDQNPSSDEQAIIDLSERVSGRPLKRAEAEEYISDTHKLVKADASSLVDLSKKTALIDEEGQHGQGILFNSHTFRDGKYAEKAHRVLEQLKADERVRLTEVQEKLTRHGALYDADVERMLGKELYNRLVSVGLFDRMEVSNSTESVGYVASPNDFQKYGRPFEEDPIDDAKALIASLTYGQSRSTYTRGQITMPEALIRALVRGDELAARAGGVRAIGEDYRELEARQVVEVTQKSYGRYTMRLLKKDVGELALTIIRGGAAAQEAVLMDGSPARAFKGPHTARTEVRLRNEIADKRFIHDTLDRLRSGG
ncbi:hypothetical protein [Brevundimonas vesicularis]|uniref:Uncharacterized protein n=1 Tax=Brevundimonas vesicularis TaxID=41276 RepID=A0ABU4KMN7_BREVE|nr:hypothetical protein [Brevundimonas vesicularis]MDX2334268.1 hypothetical protein [Brevundimonas vesicularis]